MDWTSHSPRELTAYHEAGHAVVGYVLGVPLKSVSLNADDDGGECEWDLDWDYCQSQARAAADDPQARTNLSTLLVTIYAGFSAAVHLDVEVPSPGSWAEFRQAHQLATLATGNRDTGIRKFARPANRLAGMYVRQPACWLAIQGVAAALLDRQKLTQAEVREIVRSTLTGWLEDHPEDRLARRVLDDSD